jgi:DNA-binding protein
MGETVTVMRFNEIIRENISIPQTKRNTTMTADNSIFIGNKPFMNYVTSVVMQFTTKEASEVIVKARGKFISRAVDVSEVAAKRFLVDQIAVKDIRIGSEAFENEEGKNIRVSTIEIVLAKNKG